jgi:ribosome-associated protein
LKENNHSDKEIIKVIFTALDDKFGQDIKIIDISQVSTMSDYFIITSGNNPNQVKALADEVSQKLQEINVSIKKSEGFAGGTWVLLDFDIAMVHIFTKENREFYNLEKVWEQGELIDITKI